MRYRQQHSFRHFYVADRHPPIDTGMQAAYMYFVSFTVSLCFLFALCRARAGVREMDCQAAQRVTRL